MKSSTKWVIGCLGGCFVAGTLVIAVVLFRVASMPCNWQVQRSVLIHATPGEIHGWLVSPHAWQTWSCWARDNDSSLARNYEGPHAGAGAVMSWSGDKTEVGTGRVEILECDPTLGVGYQVLYEDLAMTLRRTNATSEGMIEASSFVEISVYSTARQVLVSGRFDLQAEGDGTRVTWREEGDLGSAGLMRFFGGPMASGFAALSEQAFDCSLENLRAAVESRK